MTRTTRLLLPLFVLASGAASAATDAQIHSLIESLRPTAAAIVVDGDPSDWGAIPAFSDPTGDSGGDPARDITSVRIAPGDTDLLVLIETAGAPIATGFSFAYRLRFDFDGFQCHDVEIAPDVAGPDGLSWFDQGGCSGFTGDNPSWDGTEIAIGTAVEIRVPYAVLDAALPASMQGKLSGASARPWVRVEAFTIDFLPTFTEVDLGAAVGSYRLVPTPYALDAALPAGGDSFTGFQMPLTGLWYVYQGPFNPLSHATIWGYDLNIMDGSLRPESPVMSANLANNYSYGESITAPATGTLFSLLNDQPDCTPYSGAGCAGVNFAFVDTGAVGLLFSHSIPGSIPFAASDPVPAGAKLGEVGNAGGFFGWPHLHYEGQDMSSLPDSVPLGMTKVVVGLNPSLDDPWQRDAASWGIREGYFVMPQPQAVPIPPGTVALLAAALLGCGVRTLRSRRRAIAS